MVLGSDDGRANQILILKRKLWEGVLKRTEINKPQQKKQNSNM